MTSPMAGTHESMVAHNGLVGCEGECTYVAYCGETLHLAQKYFSSSPLIVDEFWVKLGVGSIVVGNIICTGSFTTSAYAGGIAGSATVPFVNAKSFCKVDAINFTGKGLICGSTRETAIATNCHCGGIITESGANADGDPVSKEVVVTADNYYKYIYGTEIDAATAKTDYCGYISAIDATPVDSDGSAIVLPEPAPEPEPAPAPAE